MPKQKTIIENETVQNETTVLEIENPTLELGADLEGAEDAKNLTTHIITSNTPKYNDIEWLNEHNPMDYVNDTVTSSKFDADREIKILDGLTILASLTIGTTKINPLLILLARYWEIKPARAEVKKLIDAEAIALGFSPDVYLQLELGKQVDGLAEIQSAVDRIKYAKTYYKPRNKVLIIEVITKTLNIDGVQYKVPVGELEKAKVQFKDANDGNAAMKAYLIPLSTKIEIVEIESI